MVVAKVYRALKIARPVFSRAMMRLLHENGLMDSCW